MKEEKEQGRKGNQRNKRSDICYRHAYEKTRKADATNRRQDCNARETEEERLWEPRIPTEVIILTLEAQRKKEP